ncbi:MAG: NADH:flavin oxidoreductase/NADH oxidase [Bacteroidetes bacterium]|nr:NADH:flavin oxidoreductase/NADH oxidase [Bacteroidota bacterium]
MSHLFQPLKLREIELKNRIMVSPMCQYSSTDGFANEWHLVHLGSRAVGGAALVMTEATAVSPEGRISINDLGIWKDEHIPMLQTITGFILEHDAVPGIQLAHAGRKGGYGSPWKGDHLLSLSEGGWENAAPSAIPFSTESSIPVALTPEGIGKVVRDFISAARRALEAGFLVIEIHAAHGYLIHEFLSPFSNKREDAYGGSFENRIRLLCEIVSGIRSVWPSTYPLFVRISSSEWVEGGWTIGDSIALTRILKDLGADLMDCSSGGNIKGVKIPLVPGYQVPFAEKIRKETGMLTGTVGLITTATQAESILEQGQADLIILARQMLRNPYFPLEAALELGDDVTWPRQYLRAKRKP